jgi:GNAT superfamily N-acetyltransferase
MFFLMTMRIRTANQNDAEAIAASNLALAKESENIILSGETVLSGVTSLLSDDTKGFYLVAEEKERIIGQLMITTEWSDWRNKPIWWVQSVYVQKEWRKKGVFTQLLREVKKKARDENVALLRLYVHNDNTSAHQVYKNLGWKQEPYEVYCFSL